MSAAERDDRDRWGSGDGGDVSTGRELMAVAQDGMGWDGWA